MIDPLVHTALRGLMIVIVGAALMHKSKDFQHFVDIVDAYNIAPKRAAYSVACAVIAGEAVVFAILVGGVFPAAGFAAAGMFAFYGALMAVKIARGQSNLDCGCSWVKQARLSSALCWRNAVLVVLCLTLTAPQSARSLLRVDFVNAACFAVVAAGVYFLADALLHMKKLEAAQ